LRTLPHSAQREASAAPRTIDGSCVAAIAQLLRASIALQNKQAIALPV